jgi:hypothetical protein
MHSMLQYFLQGTTFVWSIPDVLRLARVLPVSRLIGLGVALILLVCIVRMLLTVLTTFCILLVVGWVVYGLYTRYISEGEKEGG